MRVESRLFPPRYRDPEWVARGGMGDVFRATDAELGRAVAIKVLADRYTADADVRQRFTREALAAARLSSGPSTIKIFDVGECQGRPFIVMEYLAGGSLADVLRRKSAQPFTQVLGWLAEAATALDYAHAHGVVHRDVKPANLLLDHAGDVHVADFGIASAAGLASVTQTGTVLGTLGYLAPEQAAGERATAAVDRYALGVVAFELLTGERPYAAGESPTAETAALGAVPVPSISERNPSLSPSLDEVFERALSYDPGSRFPSCAGLVEAIGAAAARTVETAPTRVADERPSRRCFELAAVLVAVVAALAGVAAVWLFQHMNGQAAPPPVRRAHAAVAPRARPTPRNPADARTRALLEAATQIRLGHCKDALSFLERAIPTLGARGAMDQLRAVCSTPPGHRPGHGHGRGHRDKERD